MRTKKRVVQKPWVPLQPVTGNDMASSPFGHCAGCFGIKDSRTSHYPGTVEHPFTERQADNYKLGREIDDIAAEV